MKPGLINPAVFAYTLYVKFQNPFNFSPIAILLLLPCFFLLLYTFLTPTTLSPEEEQKLTSYFANFYADGKLCFLIAYFFISDAYAGKKIISESDSLTLLFTRPITRFSYVMTKFCATFLGSSLALTAGLTVTYIVSLLLGYKANPPSLLDFLTRLFNVASWSSVMVFLHSAPPLVGLLSSATIIGCSSMGNMFSRADQNSNFYFEIYRNICLFLNDWLGDLLPARIDLNDLFSALSFDTYEFAVNISNIAIFLLLASVALSKREFFYGSD